MKIALLVFFSAISFSCSAQWWNVLKPKRYPEIVSVQPVPFQIKKAELTKSVVSQQALEQTEFALMLSEISMRKMAQHNMRFHEYTEASYNFRDLAKIYLKLNKLIEAKWFYLQSLMISREQKNDRLTIMSLMELATLKYTIGDFDLAKQDLQEAKNLASSHDWKDDMALVGKKTLELEGDRLASVKGGSGLGTSVTAL